MKFSKIILMILSSIILFANNAYSQKKDTKEVKKAKENLANAKKIEQIEKEIKDTEEAAKKKNAKKKISKKKQTEAIVEEDTIDANGKGTGIVLTGIASFYSASFEGKQTANGEIFRHSKLTCASNKFPLGTWLKITNLRNNKTIVVKVNDRMHPRMKRIVDLTLTGAKKLDFVAAGLTQVKAEVIKKK